MNFLTPASANLPEACTAMVSVSQTMPILFWGFVFALGWFVRESASSLVLIGAAAWHDLREIARVWVYRRITKRV